MKAKSESAETKEGSVASSKRHGAASGSTSAPRKKQTPVRPLTPFDVFNCCLQRARNLLKIHKAAHGNQARPEAYLADAHRAAIVLSISALDAYIRTFLIHQIRKVVADQNNSLPDVLAVKIKIFIKDDALLEAARRNDLLDRVEKAFRTDFEKKSFQGVRNIDEGLKLIGYKNIFHDIAVNASVNEDTLKKDLDRYTKRRHIIAHAGDYDLSQNPAVENKILKKDAEECIKLISVIAKQINTLE